MPDYHFAAEVGEEHRNTIPTRTRTRKIRKERPQQEDPSLLHAVAKPNWGDLCVFLPGIGLLHDEIVIGTGPDSKGGDTVVRKTAVVSTMSFCVSPETVWANRRFFRRSLKSRSVAFSLLGSSSVAPKFRMNCPSICLRINWNCMGT